MQFQRQKSERYVSINTDILRNRYISLKAKGFFLTVMGLPPDWDFSVRGMVSILKEQRDSIYSIIQELEAFGYCSRTQSRNNDGTLTPVLYTFHEEPLTAFPDTVNPDTDNPTQYNKEVFKECDIEEKEKKSMSKLRSDACAVIESWKSTLGHPLAKCDETKQRKVMARLREGFSAEDLMRMQQGVLKSPWHLGDNPSKKRYDGISTIYQSAEHVEKFLALVAPPEKKGCPVCVENNPYRNRMSLKPGQVFNETTKRVEKCLCIYEA